MRVRIYGILIFLSNIGDCDCRYWIKIGNIKKFEFLIQMLYGNSGLINSIELVILNKKVNIEN